MLTLEINPCVYLLPTVMEKRVDLKVLVLTFLNKTCCLAFFKKTWVLIHSSLERICVTAAGKKKKRKIYIYVGAGPSKFRHLLCKENVSAVRCCFFGKIHVFDLVHG
jgi:hypothetical protein